MFFNFYSSLFFFVCPVYPFKGRECVPLWFNSLFLSLTSWPLVRSWAGSKRFECCCASCPFLSSEVRRTKEDLLLGYTSIYSLAIIFSPLNPLKGTCFGNKSFKASPSGEVWRGNMFMSLYFTETLFQFSKPIYFFQLFVHIVFFIFGICRAA